MNVKRETRKIVVRTFAFDENEYQAFDTIIKICNKIRLDLDFEGASEMVSNFIGEVITYEDLARTQEMLECLITTNEMSWDLK